MENTTTQYGTFVLNYNRKKSHGSILKQKRISRDASHLDYISIDVVKNQPIPIYKVAVVESANKKSDGMVPRGDITTISAVD
jgi:hypothetical protein